MNNPESSGKIDFLLSRENKGVILIFLAAFFIRFAFLAASDNFLGEQPMLKLITSLHVFSSPGFFENIYYQQLPFYLYSLAFSVWLGGEQFIAGRMYSLLIASLTIILFYYFVKMLFGKKNAILSGVLLCCCPEHIIKSVLTLPDINTIFFILLCLYFFVKGKPIITALFVLIAGANDYLPWIFIPIILLSFLPFDKKGKRAGINSMLLFLLISVIFPVLWSALIVKNYGSIGFLLSSPESYYSWTQFVFCFMYNVRELLALLVNSFHPVFF